MTFRVLWEIDVDASSPEAAAAVAWALMRGADSSACVFDVVDARGEKVRVDLDAAALGKVAREDDL